MPLLCYHIPHLCLKIPHTLCFDSFYMHIPHSFSHRRPTGPVVTVFHNFCQSVCLSVTLGPDLHFPHSDHHLPPPPPKFTGKGLLTNDVSHKIFKEGLKKIGYYLVKCGFKHTIIKEALW